MQPAVASWNRRTLGNLYANAFDPDDYLKTYYGSLDAEVEFFLRNLHDFFSAKEETWARSSSRDERQTHQQRVLEVGSGPTVTSIISASRWSERIICSDFLEANRKKISHWLTTAAEEGQEADVWESFFQYVARLENAGRRSCPSPPIDTSWLRKRVKQSVRAVVSCDVFLRPPLINSCRDGAATTEKTDDDFDVVISTLCLEFASASLDDYRAAVANVASLVRPSGYLIMQGALGNTHYWHNGRLFPSVTLSRTCVEEALSAAACSVQTWNQLERSCPPQQKPADHTACFCCVARKNPI